MRKEWAFMSSRFKKTLPVIAAFVAVIVMAALAVFRVPDDKIAKGVYARNTYIGGMDREGARSKIIKAQGTEVPELVLYTFCGIKTHVKSDEIGLAFDIEKTLDEAFSKGRGSNILENAKERIGLRFSPVDIGYIYSYDKEKLRDIIFDFGVSVNGETMPYILEYGEETVLVKRGKAGQREDVSVDLEALDKAVRHGHYEVFLVLKKGQEPMPNLRSLYDATYLKPKDAEYRIENKGVVILPEMVGRQIDMADAATKIEAIRRGEQAELKLIPLKPEVTLEDLNKKLFNYTLAQYTTAYNMKDEGRSANVALAADKINGMVLAPGAVFSYNQVVGPRTAAAGFSPAPVFENGETVQGMGGGVCQVSSTLYSAVLYADLDIVSRRNHSMTVAYVPKGQDATVSYGTIDFKFKNSTPYPIKILASAGGGKMNVSIQGTKPEIEKTVKIVNNVVAENPPKVIEIQDGSLDAGKKKVISSGKTGYTVTTFRIVYENGNEVKNENLGNSVYKMVPAEVKVGTKLPKPTPEPTPEAVIEPEPEEITENTPPEV